MFSISYFFKFPKTNFKQREYLGFVNAKVMESQDLFSFGEGARIGVRRVIAVAVVVNVHVRIGLGDGAIGFSGGGVGIPSLGASHLGCRYNCNTSLSESLGKFVCEEWRTCGFSLYYGFTIWKR